MSSAPSPVWSTVDFEAPGKQFGHLNLPHSVHRSGYGQIPIPICVINHGTGPTALLMGGNHGDEYEGQVGLLKLIRAVEPAMLQGRVIIIPAINLPAARAGTRTSPLDAGNLNRSFPGATDRGPTAMIAHYLNHKIFPLCAVMHDFHSGGSSMHYLHHATIALSGEPEHDRRAIAAIKAFGPPRAKLMQPRVFWNSSHPAATAQGMIALGGEFGGAGDVSPEGVTLIEMGQQPLGTMFDERDAGDVSPISRSSSCRHRSRPRPRQASSKSMVPTTTSLRATMASSSR
ncbi:MAG: succinylglutamate desuccinylase/aspartoacylase family protein [Pseudomonadota bacterium]